MPSAGDTPVRDGALCLEYFITFYGYWGVLLGTILGGETVLIIGGLCAKLGLLRLPVVMLVAFVGSFSGDRACFFLGCFKGRQILAGHPLWAFHRRKRRKAPGRDTGPGER